MKVKCNQCGKPIEDEFLMIGDNFLQVNFFDEADGSDNVFCSQECICGHLSVISSNIKEKENENNR